MVPAPSARAPEARTRLLAGALLAICIGVIAACGGTPGGNDSNPPSSPSTSGTVPSGADGADAPTTKATTRSTGSTGTSVRRTATSTTEDPEATTTSSSSVRSSTTSSSITLNPTAGNEQFCTEFLSTIQQIDAMGKTETPEQITQALTELKAAFQKLTDLAPDAIKADWTQLNTALQSASSPNDLDKLSGPELDAATKRIETWTKDNCGFDPNEL